MNLEILEKILKNNNQPKFRLNQIKKAVYKDGISSFLEILTIPKNLRELLRREMKISSFEVDKVIISNYAKSAKALLKLSDNNFIETVLLSPRPDSWTACISSQVGCPLGCAFCATGKVKFKRNLTAEEITDQILFWKQYLKSSSVDLAPAINNVVYMGMGEPFLNWEEVKKSLRNLIDFSLFDFGSRSISVSTVGVKNGIEKFLEEFPQVNLAISLHFADNEMRSKFMPANKNYNLDDLKNDLKKYFTLSSRKVFIEYIMFDNLNDSTKNSKKLVEYLNSIGNSYLLHVNLIPYNVEHGKYSTNIFRASSVEKIERFKNYLLRNNINATIRKSLGNEIAGACGQLAGKII